MLAPDRPGLLWAISAWLQRADCNVLVARAAPAGLQADDSFLVDGTPDPDDLASYRAYPRITFRLAIDRVHDHLED